MAENFRNRLIELGGVAIADDYVLSPEREGARWLFRNDGGEVLRVSSSTLEVAVEFAVAYLKEHPNPRVTFLGPPTPSQT